LSEGQTPPIGDPERPSALHLQPETADRPEPGNAGITPERVPFYDALADDYDRFVNWQGRLAHELPFFEHLFAEQGVQRLLDAACGTGHHAIALAQRGYQAVGADLSRAMIHTAQRNARAAGVDVQFLVAGFVDMARLGATFDAVLCLGTSLPHLLTAQAVERALADFAAVLRPGGLLVIQNRNFDRILARRDRFMDPQTHRDGSGEWVFVRFYDFHPETITFNMIRLRRASCTSRELSQPWNQTVEATELRPILQHELAGALAHTGFARHIFYGSYDRSPFDPDTSGDLIAVATRSL
jgi:glycine/sarcosine N-methyltransferase